MFVFSDSISVKCAEISGLANADSGAGNLEDAVLGLPDVHLDSP